MFVNNVGIGFNELLLIGDIDYWCVMLDLNVLVFCVCMCEGVFDMWWRGDDGYVFYVFFMVGYCVFGGSGVYFVSKFVVWVLIEGLC